MIFLNYLQPTQLEIYNTLQQANVVVLENHQTCGTEKQWDGWTFTTKDYRNSYNRTMLVMCTTTLKANYEDWKREINRTISHEAVHVAQACKEGRGSLEILGFKNDFEKEAFAIQDNPKEVLRILKKYCF
jgi:hypothetical protein